MIPDPPLVSCLMVTKRGRQRLAARAIGDFFRQDYPNRELVVAVTDAGTHDDLCVVAEDWQHNPRGTDTGFGAHWRSPSVTFVRADETTLGDLRNRTMDAADASSEFYVQWDDDDRYHPARLSTQLAAFAPDDVAVCLSSQLYYFAADRVVYWVDWFKRLPQFTSVMIPGTIAARASAARPSRYPSSGPAARKGEDGAHLEAVLGRGKGRVIGDGELYLRRFHGDNTWDHGHFLANARWLGLTAAELKSGDAVDRIVAAFAAAGYAEGYGNVTIMGGDGIIASSFEK